ncbi:ATP-dependent DNA helicase RecG [Isoptericola sp. CG 20/1183]|uniref:ATP-dependent DNA helicase RecG n=1 Tax=Isoptericola halotolerans TaxID=300560 RepID=A0ABX5EDF0_9MICO|nr:MULTISPECIES: OB-fold nucleic acid binding domain-containing protein [Isoptericola]MCK0115633.1 OB-fold nucleic acid binding domain-containing protein [Isoptericola sp. S6320L]PRZ03837.1 ATP-dependent DNA helicase RecG [Isoptericola sp. CG 20/1183]PRZ04030.1 ATP-dependent DNA helicase RecG [Isoptericola halotolerans]
MSLRSKVRSAFASADDVAADEERTAAALVTGCRPLDDLTPRERSSAAGVLRSVVLRPREKVPTVEAELYDGSGTLHLVWLGRREIAGIQPGRRLRVDGMVTVREGRRTMYNPRYELRARAGE